MKKIITTAFLIAFAGASFAASPKVFTNQPDSVSYKSAPPKPANNKKKIEKPIKESMTDALLKFER